MSDPALSSPLSSAMQDAQGAYSSRRVAAFVALGCLVVGFVVVLGCVAGQVVTGKTLDPALMSLMGNLVNVMATAAVGGLALATADRWAPK